MLTAWILTVFVVGAATMMRRVAPALLALPLMALGIVAGAALFGDASHDQVFGGQGVLAEGVLRLHKPMIVALLGGVLSFIVQRSGAAERMVKTGAELGGDTPS